MYLIIHVQGGSLNNAKNLIFPKPEVTCNWQVHVKNLQHFCYRLMSHTTLLQNSIPELFYFENKKYLESFHTNANIQGGSWNNAKNFIFFKPEVRCSWQVHEMNLQHFCYCLMGHTPFLKNSIPELFYFENKKSLESHNQYFLYMVFY